MHLVDLNEIPWQSDSHGRQTKAIESGITLWSFPGPGSFELNTHSQHTWLVLKGRGRLQFGQRIVAISGGVVLSDLYDSFAIFIVPQEEEIVLMDVVLAPSRLPTEASPPATVSQTDAETDATDAMSPIADLDVLLGEAATPEEMPSSIVVDSPPSEPAVEPTSTQSGSLTPDPTVTEAEPADEDPPLPWTAKLRSH